MFQTARLIDVRIARLLQHAIRSDSTPIDYSKLTQDAILFKRATLGIMEQLRELYLPERLAARLQSSMQPDTEKPLPATPAPVLETQAPLATAGPDPEERVCADERPSTPMTGTGPITAATKSSRQISEQAEQLARFKQFLANRKARRESGLQSAPADMSPTECFKWQGSDISDATSPLTRVTSTRSKVRTSCADVPVMLDVNPRPREPSRAKLAAWEKWRQSDCFASGHPRPNSARTSKDSAYSLRTSSVYSKAVPLPAEANCALHRSDSSSAEDHSPTHSRASSASSISTRMTSPASLAGSDSEWDQHPSLKVAELPGDLPPPAIPERSPLRALRKTRENSDMVIAPLSLHRPSTSAGSQISCSTTHTSTPAEPISSARRSPQRSWTSSSVPTRSTEFDGFCKGVWAIRKDPDEGMKTRTRPSGLFGRTSFSECRSCSYRSQDFTHKTATTDTRVYAAAGVLYRRVFLAKSHARTRPDAEDEYGCLFCFEEGRPGCVHDGVIALMGHIVSEHAWSMDAEVQGKTKCVFGRVADGHEDFDICIPITSPRRLPMGWVVQESEDE